MLKFQDKKLSKSRLKTWTRLSLLVLLALFFAKELFDIYNKNKSASIDRRSSDKELSELEERRDYLVDKMASLKTNRGQEAEIRRNFSVVKPGEKVLVIVGSEDSTTSTSTEDEWLERIKMFFK
jgi:cell division protein FtsB